MPTKGLGFALVNVGSGVPDLKTKKCLGTVGDEDGSRCASISKANIINLHIQEGPVLGLDHQVKPTPAGWLHDQGSRTNIKHWYCNAGDSWHITWKDVPENGKQMGSHVDYAVSLPYRARAQPLAIDPDRIRLTLRLIWMCLKGMCLKGTCQEWGTLVRVDDTIMGRNVKGRARSTIQTLRIRAITNHTIVSWGYQRRLDCCGSRHVFNSA